PAPVLITSEVTLSLYVSYSTVSSTPLAPGTSNSCRIYYLVQLGDTCDIVAAKYNTTFDQLRVLNTGLDSECTNLWRDYYYCMA
ncbi:hypothetical protein BU23DRAFT_436313, partial [Bimuria novae-zelandiae CBS 107.79]